MENLVKIALVMNDNFSVWHFRRGLIKSLIDKGLIVHALTPPGPYTERIESLGARHIEIPLGRFMNPMKDVVTIATLARIFRRERYDIVYNMQNKALIFGAIAARLAGVRHVTALVEGLGYPFFIENPRFRQRMIGRVVLALLRVGCKLTHKVCFENSDDLGFFRKSGFLSSTQAVQLPGIGIDISEFSPASVDRARAAELRRDLRLEEGRMVVMMVVARMIWCKGVKEFLEAAAIVAPHRPKVTFALIGPFDEGHPDAVPVEYFKRGLPSNVCLSTEFVEDIRELLSLADVVVLPTYFREGQPRVLLEGLALGKPIVTTDRPGCRETVHEGRNGFIVSARDSKGLAGAILKMTGDSALITRFGQHSRHRAETEFDERFVVHTIFTQVYGF